MAPRMRLQNPVLALMEKHAQKCHIVMERQSFRKESRFANTMAESLFRNMLTDLDTV